MHIRMAEGVVRITRVLLIDGRGSSRKKGRAKKKRKKKIRLWLV